MFQINDYVVYGLTGVCRITDIVKEKIYEDKEVQYYVLKPVYGDNMIIKIPVKTTKISIRKTMSKEDVMSLIASMPQQETVWLEDNRERSESFKAALKTGKGEEWIKLIKTIYLERAEKAASGKKLSKTDEDILKVAEKQLNEEFALALGILPDEVTSFIMDHLPEEAH